MAGTDCSGNKYMADMLDGDNTGLRNTGADSETSRSPNLSSQQASVDSVGSFSENNSWKSSFSHDSRSICTIPETRHLNRAQSEDCDAVRPKQRGVLLKQYSIACDSRTGPKALNRDKSFDVNKPMELNKSLDSNKSSSEMSKSMKSLKSASDLKDISPDLKVRETELLKARYQNIMSKKIEQNTLIKQCSEPESFRHKIKSKQKIDKSTKSFDNFLDVPKPFIPSYNRQSSDESSSSKKDYLSSSSKSFDSESSSRCISVSPRQRNKRTISEEGFRKKEKYRMSLKHKPVKSFDNFIDNCAQSTKSSLSQHTTISVEDEDGMIIENEEEAEMIPLRGLSTDEGDNIEKFDISFESIKNKSNVSRTPLVGLLSRSVGNIKEKTSKLRTLVRRKSNSLMTIKSSDTQENQPPPDINVVSNEDIILNDTLLDGNITDILFAIDTLWPTKQ